MDFNLYRRDRKAILWSFIADETSCRTRTVTANFPVSYNWGVSEITLMFVRSNKVSQELRWARQTSHSLVPQANNWLFSEANNNQLFSVRTLEGPFRWVPGEGLVRSRSKPAERFPGWTFHWTGSNKMVSQKLSSKFWLHSIYPALLWKSCRKLTGCLEHD